MHLSQVEEHLETLLDPESPGSEATRSNVRAALTQLSELQIEASPLLVAEDVLAIEVNPMTDEPGAPTAFGVLFVRRLFLRASEDDS
ncbi:MAG: hypothetical protein Q7T55_09225, partial [Solirubrobacteraceae bacterium]|nr:hypothetical protein [Solirubrobacteraceae bacterium]